MGQASILMYHHVVSEPDSPWEVSPEQLRRHVVRLRRQGFRFGAMSDVLRGEDVVVLTFDDGYLNVFESAFPLLSEMGVPATVFIPVQHAGGTNTYDCLSGVGPRRVARIMTWRHLAELSRAGWSVESHGCSHLPMGLLLDGHIQDEVRRSKEEIEGRLGVGVSTFSYPFGMPPGDERQDFTEAVLAEAGYRMAVLAGGGPTRTPPPLPFRVCRVPVTGEGADLLAQPTPVRTGGERA
jgi:peptidoglycan/xylan/chitin deacetylase (PgdA/CDA1 family)